jgi:lysophospholipase L1-like esterase
MTSMDRRSFLGVCGALVLGGACSTTTVGQATPGTALGTAVPPARETVPGRGPIRSISGVGDSILRASTKAATTVFNTAGVTDVQIDAETGRRIEVGNGLGAAPLSGLRTVAAQLKKGAAPDLWLVVLGTNDIGSYSKAEQFGALIDEMLQLFPKATPVVWMNVYRQQYPELSLVFNAVLQQRIDARANAVVADWHTTASAPKQSVLRDDGIHPNAQGVAVIAQLLGQALQRL